MDRPINIADYQDSLGEKLEFPSHIWYNAGKDYSWAEIYNVMWENPGKTTIL